MSRNANCTNSTRIREPRLPYPPFWLTLREQPEQRNFRHGHGQMNFLPSPGVEIREPEVRWREFSVMGGGGGGVGGRATKEIKGKKQQIGRVPRGQYFRGGEFCRDEPGDVLNRTRSAHGPWRRLCITGSDSECSAAIVPFSNLWFRLMYIYTYSDVVWFLRNGIIIIVIIIMLIRACTATKNAIAQIRLSRVAG